MKCFLLVLMVLGLTEGAFAANDDSESHWRDTRDQSADLRGIYTTISNPFPLTTVQQHDLEPALTDSLAHSGVDGLLLVLRWDGLEPTVGHYIWESGGANPLDYWIGQAMSSGKEVEIAVRSDLAPGWLFHFQPPEGANPLMFTYASNPGRKGCDPTMETIAAPWDPAFLRQWGGMLAALANHLQTIFVNGKSEYDAVKLLRLTGIDRNSDELHLPEQTPQDPNTPCVTDAVTTWLAAGYRPSLLLSGWDSITSLFKENFPDKSFSVALIDSSNPFPPIAEDGSVITNMSPKDLSVAQNEPLVTLASRKFPGHLVIQNNSLYEGVPAQPETIDFARSLETMIAFQTNLDLGAEGGASCTSGTLSDPAVPCMTSNDFLELLESGIYPLGTNNCLRAQYIEVFAPNVVAFPGAIEKAHAELTIPPSRSDRSCVFCDQSGWAEEFGCFGNR